jgi:Holliday junction resolvase-like predicted endonuclease
MEEIQTKSHPKDDSHPMDDSYLQGDEPPGFKTVWATLDRITEEHKEIDRIVKANAHLIGKLSKRMGEVVEYIVAPNLREKFRELGYDFPKANTNSDVSDRTNKIYLEIDVMLENGDKAMLVEVKTKPTTEDVQDHVKRIEKMREYADLHGDNRTFLGAVAGVVMTDNVKEYVFKQGFFLIEPSGETFNIIPPDGQPKEW